jgi:hypothetical protein
MQRSRIIAALAVLLSFAALTTSAQDEDQYIKVDIKGTLKTGVVVIGGETTGTTITVKGKGTLDVTRCATIQRVPGQGAEQGTCKVFRRTICRTRPATRPTVSQNVTSA